MTFAHYDPMSQILPFLSNMFYVYILQSIVSPDKFYTGFTVDPEQRLIKHNEGGNKYTKAYRPWEYKNIFGFRDKNKAEDFEKYLKSSSGRAFAKKHL